MSQDGVDFVKGLISAPTGMDKRAILASLPAVVPQLCHPEVEWIEDPDRADAQTHRGHKGVIESWARWLEHWDAYDIEVERVVDCGDEVLVYARERARGTASGASVQSRHFSVWTIRDGKLLRFREFYDEQAAREAAGCA